MKKSLLYTMLILIGVLIFFFGLLMLLRQESVVNFLSVIIPNVQTFELVGVILQSFGGFLVVYYAVQFLASEFIAKSDKENQAVLYSLIQSINRVEKRTAEVVEKLDSLENSSSVQFSDASLQKCRFCRANIVQGSSFCPNCGRSQK